MKLALFGGTFDPVHGGHVAVARAAAREFGLDRVLLVPSGNPPWKAERTPYAQRYRMVELACAGEPGIEASRLEEGVEKSYTIQTVERLLAGGYTGEIYFIIGADAFAEIRKWMRWQDLAKRVTFIVVSRPGHCYEVPVETRVLRLDDVHLEVSSSDVREALQRGESPAGVPEAVLRYIREQGLYRDNG